MLLPSWIRISKGFHYPAVALFAVFLVFVYQYVSYKSLESASSPQSIVVRSVDVGQSSETVYTDLVRRDDYSCGPGRPCANGACCGSTGYCGYGSAYCGTGCSSNCNATAECGQFASPTGKTCPLNTCCSQYGFCGTTSDFCTNKCQSNCVQHPSPPGGGGTGNVLNRVIGYYESWSDRSACHRTAPGDLPLDALTHVNYAFAYIDPSSFQIVTMDPQTPASLFQSVSDLKSYKSSLKVFISVGGWTFSNNGTATQPVFGNIASSSVNRQKFASNTLTFMNQYGFDGIDIDWEYPGAPDRGGSPQDTANFVSLLETLRSTFNTSPRSLGITFTAPSSYWYLRWFDLPNLVKYADWINLMTYDLHGVWDRNNPIGSIVQAHTNLTEIKLATELLWRVGISPSKVSMGFGFYGRSFQLSSSSCSTPGCSFSGGAAPGPCSATSGILTYYEIKALLAQNTGLIPTFDTVAAVKYVTFNGNQWVSYDDADTFKLKVAWANGVGIGGSLIWASDLDDDKYSAHSGLLGRTIAHVDLSAKAFSANPASVAQNLVGQNGQDCTISRDCTATDNPQASRCPPGTTKLGWERGNCGKNYGHSICCPSATAPTSCIWRGSGGDCNGQCHPGEAMIFGSSWGGFPTESNQNKCSRGYKVFCCDAGDWKDVIAGCYWSGCGGSCKSTESSVSTTVKGCALYQGKKQYCCANPSPLKECVWRGSFPDCPNAKCMQDEVAIELSQSGDAWVGACSWGRQLTDCCKVVTLPTTPLTCTATLCDIDPGLCAISDDDGFGSSFKRDLNKKSGLYQSEVPQRLEKRGGRRPFNYLLDSLSGTYLILSRAYPSRGQLFNTRDALQNIIRRWWVIRATRCDDSTVASESIDPNNLPLTGETEHPIDLQVIIPYIQGANRGRLPSGGFTRTSRIPSAYWAGVWRSATGLQAGLPRVSPTSPELRNPSDRIMEAFGSTTNRNNFVLAERQINAAKGSIFGLEGPISVANFAQLSTRGAGIDDDAAEEALQEIRAVISVFRYLNDPLITTRYNNVAASLRAQLVIIEANTAGGTGLAAHFDEFWPDYQRQIEIFSQVWVQDRINQMRQIYNQIGPTPRNRLQVFAALLQLESQIPTMRLP